MALIPCFDCGQSVSEEAPTCRGCGRSLPDTETEAIIAGPGGVVVEPGWRSALSGPLFARKQAQPQVWVAGEDPANPPLRLLRLDVSGARLEVPPRETRKYVWETRRRMGPMRLVTHLGIYTLKGNPDAIEGFFRGLGIEIREGLGRRVRRQKELEKFLLRLGWVLCLGFSARDLVYAVRGAAPLGIVLAFLLIFGGGLFILWYYTRFKRPWAVSGAVSVLLGVCWAYFGLLA